MIAADKLGTDWYIAARPAPTDQLETNDHLVSAGGGEVTRGNFEVVKR
jgi:hypothetical protein